VNLRITVASPLVPFPRASLPTLPTFRALHVPAIESAIGEFSNSHDYFDGIGHGAIPEKPADVGVWPLVAG
jgi:hypothetical protein